MNEHKLLTVAYDKSEGLDRDRSCLVVSRKTASGKIEILNCFWDKQAEEMYEQLVSVHGCQIAKSKPTAKWLDGCDDWFSVVRCSNCGYRILEEDQAVKCPNCQRIMEE